MTVIPATTLAHVRRAYSSYYSSLANVFVRELGDSVPKVVLEVGCGKGQLTIPLANMLPGTRIIAADSSRGPYQGWLEDFSTALSTSEMRSRINIVKADARRLSQINDRSVDAIVSNELLCDLPRKDDLARALHEFHRVLRAKGVMAHGEWSSWPENGSQSFLIRHWPSWTPDQIFSMAKKVGFTEFRVTYFDTTINFGYKPAVEELKGWGASDKMLRRYDNLLRRDGIRLPFEHIIRCRKMSRPATVKM